MPAKPAELTQQAKVLTDWRTLAAIILVVAVAVCFFTWTLDERYMPRGELEARLDGMQRTLDRIFAHLDAEGRHGPDQ